MTLPEPRCSRYDSLDIWRGIACLAVVVYHSAGYGLFVYGAMGVFQRYDGVVLGLMMKLVRHAGQGGVTIFFVLSGYCIATTVDRSRRRDRPVFRYFRRRLRRIYPPYWIALSLTVVLAIIVSAFGGYWIFSQSLAYLQDIPAPWSLTAGEWVGNLTLTETWREHLWTPSQFLLGPAWTLCYEEQFYAVFGLILWLCPRRMFPAAAAVSLITGIAYAAVPSALSGTFLDGRWWLFAMGIAVYYALNYAPRAGWWLWLATLFLTAIAVKAMLAPHLASEFFDGSMFAVVLLILHRWDEAIASLKLLRPLKFCGTICYSLYLAHWPVVKPIGHLLYLGGVTSAWRTLLISVPIGVAASLAVAIPFYYAVERRFLNPSTPFSSSGGRTATNAR